LPRPGTTQNNEISQEKETENPEKEIANVDKGMEIQRRIQNNVQR